jgi:predicted nucleotidyltransferase
MTRFGELLQRLTQGGVEFIVVGGIAAAAHGLARSTLDLDVVYSRTRENLEKLAKVMEPLDPQLRGAPPGLPFRMDVATLRQGLNFTLATKLGWIDLLGEITGGGGYEQLQSSAEKFEVFGVSCLILDLEKLIQTKRAAGRPKDLESIAELEILRGRRQG